MSNLRVDELESLASGRTVLVDDIDTDVRKDLANPVKGAEMVAYREGTVHGALSTLASGLWPDASGTSLEDFANNPTTERLVIAAGRHQFSEGITITNKNLREIVGNGAVLDFSSSTSGGLVIEGELTEITTPTGIQVGAQTLTVDADISYGDVLIVWNPTDGSFNTARPHYYDGFMVEVFDYNPLTKQARLSGTVPSGDFSTVRAFILPDGSLDISGLTVIPPLGGGTGITVRYRKGVTVHPGTSFQGEDVYTGMYIDRCFDVRILAGKGRASNSDAYPLSIGNSQSVVVDGFYGVSSRHGIALGGTGHGVATVPTRDVLITNSILSNTNISSIGASDSHGNCINVSYNNCVLKDGISIGGSDIYYRNCQIFTSSYGVSVAGSELTGGVYSLENCSINVDGVNTSNNRPLFALTLTPGTKRRVDIVISNLTITGKTSLLDLLSMNSSTSEDKGATVSVSGLRVLGDVSIGVVLRAVAISEAVYNWQNLKFRFDDTSNFYANSRPTRYFSRAGTGTGTPKFDIRGHLEGPATYTVPAGTSTFTAPSVPYDTAWPDPPTRVVVSKKGGDEIGGKFFVFGCSQGSSNISLRGRSVDGDTTEPVDCEFYFQAQLIN